jgi:hypothetical protein
MPTAMREIQNAVVAALLAAPAVAGGRVYAGRDRPLPTEHATDVQVRQGSLRGEQAYLGTHPVDWEATLGLELRARGSSANDAEAAVDPLLEAVFARLATTAPPAGVDGWLLDVGGRIEIDDAEAPVASMLLTISVRYRTQTGSLTLAP